MSYYLRIVLVSVGLALLTAALVATAPRPTDVTVVDQAPNGQGVPRDAEVRVVFSRPVDRASAEVSFRVVPVVTGSFRWDGEALVFRPAQPLAAQTWYDITIRPGLRDSTGRPNRAETRWTFRTR